MTYTYNIELMTDVEVVVTILTISSTFCEYITLTSYIYYNDHTNQDAKLRFDQYVIRILIISLQIRLDFYQLHNHNNKFHT